MTAPGDTALSLRRYVDRRGLYHADGMQWRVRVLDARMAYGNIQLLITPEGGAGSRWVVAERVVLS